MRDIRVRRRAAVLVLIVTTTFASACGGGDGGGPPDGGAGARADAAADADGAIEPDTDDPVASERPCPLDAASVTAAVGLEMEKLSTGSCSFGATDPGSGRLIEVHYSRVDAIVFEGSEGEEVPGVGDGARWDKQLSNSLVVKDGRTHFAVQVLAMGTDLPPELEAKTIGIKVGKVALSS